MHYAYYRVLPDLDTFPGQWYLHEPRTADGERIDADVLASGHAYTGKLPIRMQIANPGMEVQFTLGERHLPVVSTAIGKIIRTQDPGGAEFFPIEIDGSVGSYELMNVLRLLDCLDEQQSEFTSWTTDDHRPDLAGRYRMITKGRIDSKRAAGNHLFRLAKCPIWLVVSDEVRETLVALPNLGVTFKPL